MRLRYISRGQVVNVRCCIVLFEFDFGNTNIRVTGKSNRKMSIKLSAFTIHDLTLVILLIPRILLMLFQAPSVYLSLALSHRPHVKLCTQLKIKDEAETGVARANFSSW